MNVEPTMKSDVDNNLSTDLRPIQRALEAGNWPEALEWITSRARADLKAGANKAGLFMETLDGCCAQLAQGLAADMPVAGAPIGFDKAANIYVVTEIYHSGGHRKLLEQMIAALPEERHIVVFTGALENNRAFSIKAVTDAGGFPIYPDASLDQYDRLLWLREKLARFAGQRLFALHHPEDVLAATALAEFGGNYGARAYMVHHADTVASLGVDSPEATHLAIRAEQRANILAQRPDYNVHLLPLVYAPELAQPPLDGDFFEQVNAEGRSFLARGSLNTATCGGMHKFYAEGELSLANVLASILMTTRGYHYHIGAVSAQVKAQIETALEEAGQSLDRLVFVGEVSSVAETLLENEVDLFVTSFPTGGGLTVVEAAFAGIPIAVYGGGADRVGQYLGGLTFVPSEVLVWKTVPDLEESLRGFWRKDGIKRLEEMSAASRAWSVQGHSWDKYKRRLAAILRITERPKQKALRTGRQRVANALIDLDYYADKNPKVVEAGFKPLEHYLSHGEKENRRYHPLFDGDFYLAQLTAADRKIAREMPFTHYIMRGEACGYKPHPMFDPLFCKASFAAAGQALPQTGDPLDDSILQFYMGTRDKIAPHMLFDPDHYAREVGHVPQDRSMLVDFLEAGVKEMLAPHPLVDPALVAKSGKKFEKVLHKYLTQTKPALTEPQTTILFQGNKLSERVVERYTMAAPTLLWAHLIEGNLSECDPHTLISVSHIEKRRPGTLVSATPVIVEMASNNLGVDTHPLVSGRYILKQAPYAETLPVSLTQYFIENSVSHNIDPHPMFSTQYYLYNNHDLQGLDVSPLEHFLEHGQVEGRLPHPAFNGNSYYRRFLSDTGGGSPILDYLSRGMALFQPCLELDDTQSHLSRKMALGLFAVGSDVAACDMLAASIHPDSEFKHPTLITETRTLCSFAKEAEYTTEIYPEKRVLINRPSVVSQTHIAPPIGEYTAPAATAGVYREATLVPGNDGFISQSGCWVDHGLADFDEETTQLKENGAVVAVAGEKVLLRRYASEMAVPSGIFASGTYSHNYFHFLLEILPRVLLAAEIAPEGTPLLTDDGMPDQHYQILRLYLPKHRILRLPRHSEAQVEMLYVGSMPNNIQDTFESDMPSADAVRLHPDIIQRIARVSDDVVPSSGDGARVCLHRDSNRRKLLNSQQLNTALIERDFEIVRCQRLSFSEQLRVLSQAGGGIVAQSGAHLANMLFAPKGTRVFALFSNAPGTNFYLWSALGDLLGHEVINVAGWRVLGTAPGRSPQAHEAFTVPVSLVTPFFPLEISPSDEVDPVKEAQEHLTALYEACTQADTLTSAWGLKSGPTPEGFDAALTHNRRRLCVLLKTLPAADVTTLLEHPFFQDFSRNIRSGFVTLRNFDPTEMAVIEDIKDRFKALSVQPAEGAPEVLEPNIEQMLALGMLYIPAWKLPLLGHLDLFASDVRPLYLSWLATPPYLFQGGG